jgi:hypothetical protein
MVEINKNRLITNVNQHLNAFPQKPRSVTTSWVGRFNNNIAQNPVSHFKGV